MTFAKKKPSMRTYQAISLACFLIALGPGLFAEVPPAASDLPSSEQILAFLAESIDWYRHRVLERQITTDSVDLMFLEDNRQLAVQIFQL